MPRRNRLNQPDNDAPTGGAIVWLAVCSIIAAVLMVCVQLSRCTPPNTMPASQEEKVNLFHRSIGNATNEQMRIYNYYNDRSKP